MNKLIPLALLASVLALPAYACNDADDYAAQTKIREVLGKELYQYDNWTLSQLGNEHWYIRTKLYPWAMKIKDTCVRANALAYLDTEMSFLTDQVNDLKNPTKEADEEEYLRNTSKAIRDGEAKAAKMEWPKSP